MTSVKLISASELAEEVRRRLLAIDRTETQPREIAEMQDIINKQTTDLTDKESTIQEIRRQLGELRSLLRLKDTAITTQLETVLQQRKDINARRTVIENQLREIADLKKRFKVINGALHAETITISEPTPETDSGARDSSTQSGQDTKAAPGPKCCYGDRSTWA